MTAYRRVDDLTFEDYISHSSDMYAPIKIKNGSRDLTMPLLLLVCHPLSTGVT